MKGSMFFSKQSNECIQCRFNYAFMDAFLHGENGTFRNECRIYILYILIKFIHLNK